MAVGNFQASVINNILITFPVSTVTDWLSRCHITNTCCGSDILVTLVVWLCGPDRLQDFLKPHVTDSDNNSLTVRPIHQEGNINDLQHLFTQKFPIWIATLTMNLILHVMVQGVVQSLLNRGNIEDQCEGCSTCAAEPGPAWPLGEMFLRQDVGVNNGRYETESSSYLEMLYILTMGDTRQRDGVK
jgi:hypothetical protein